MRNPCRRFHAPLILVVALAALVSLNCEPKKSNLHVAIDVHPVGGTGIHTVSCTFTGTLSAELEEGEPITANTYWESTHAIYNQQGYTWTVDGQSKTITSSKSAPEGMTLNKPFWFVIEWEDHGGGHRLVSDTAYCE